MSVPSELKHVNKFLQQAKRMDKVKPLVAYYCRLNAVTQAMAIQDKTKDVKIFLAQLLSQLEEADTEVKNIEKDEAKKQIELFALLVFKHADDEDRAGNAQKKTVQAFHSAYVFMEVLKYFGPMAEEMGEKSNYAKWKAADIAKALREGRTPTPGPPGGLPEEEEGPQDTPMGDAEPSGPGGFTATPEPSHLGDMGGPPGGFGGPGGPGGFGGPGGPGMGQGGFGEGPGPGSTPSISDSPPTDAFGLPEIPSVTPSHQPATNPSFPSLSKPTTDFHPDHSHQPKPANNFAPSYPTHSYKPQPAPQQRYQPHQPQRHFTNEEKVAAVAQAEKFTKHALSAMRFTDVDTTISKLESVIDLLRPFASR